MSKRLVCSIHLLFLILFVPIRAQADSADLNILVDEVMQKNPELKSYRAEIDAAKGSYINSGAWSNPEFSGSLGKKKVWSEEGSLDHRGEAYDLSLAQSIEWPGRIALRKAIAKRDIELAELGLEQFKTLLKARARIELYNLFAAYEKATAAREVSEHFRFLKQTLSQRSPAGLTALLETRVIETMELNMRRKATQADLAAQSALSDWNRLRGVAASESFSLDRLSVSFEPLTSDLSSLISMAQENDFEVRQSVLELKRQGLRVGLAQNERMPAVSIGPVISQEKAGEKERMIGGAIGLPLPLWNLNQGNIDIEKARKTQSEVALTLAQQEAERHAIEASTTYKKKIEEISEWQPQAIQHFKEAAELADRHYRLGSVPVTIYIELQAQYLEALEGLHDTRREALEAAAQLELLTGGQLTLSNMETEKNETDAS